WLGADHVIEDATPPRVELLLTKNGELELGFSEAIDAESASQRILLDNQTLTWIATPGGYGLKPQGAIGATTHTLQVTSQLVDLGGNAISAPWTHSVTTGGTDQIVYERQDERITPTSTLDNLASFQGHITDPATGLVYMRNRWMDPEMGRFLTPDPMGYRDGASQYSVTAQNPFSTQDPLGLYAEAGHYYTTLYIALLLGYPENEAKGLAFFSQLPDEVSDLDAIEGAKSAACSLALSSLCASFGSYRLPDLQGLFNQREIHALNGGNSEEASRSAQRKVSSALGPMETGFAIHLLGDTFAHRVLGHEEILYETGAGHLSHGTLPEVIQQRPALYTEFALTLASALQARGGHTPRVGVSVLAKVTSAIQEASMNRYSTIAHPALAQDRFTNVLRSRIETLLGHSLPYRPERFDLNHLFGPRTSTGDVLGALARSRIQAPPYSWFSIGGSMDLDISQAFSRP
ncbi:MAG: RHS repeat-associated core domain-containing protein, partial [Thermoanaerobaculia bacterium]